jgi:predicted aspartyl protease
MREYGRWSLALAVALAVCGALACLPAGLQQAAAPAETGPGEVAFDLAGPNGAAVVVPVRIDGEGPFQFAVDTGATLTCVDVGLAERLALPEMKGTVGLGAGVGGAGALRLVSLESFEMGSSRASRLPAAVIDLQHVQGAGIEIDGLVGLNFLKNYRVTFDFERNVVELRQPGSGPGRDDGNDER